MTINVEWVASTLLVMYFAHARFNTPRHNRSSTTRAQFQFAQTGYILTAVALFAVLSSLLVTSPQIAGALFGGTTPPDYLKGLNSPMLAALFMTTLLPQLGILSQVDSGLLKRFQNMGNIPTAVRQLSDKLHQSQLQFDAEARAALTQFVVNRDVQPGIRPEDLNMDGANRPGYTFTRMLHFYLRLEQLKIEPRYANFCEEYAEELDAAEKSVTTLLDVADRFFPLYRGRLPVDGKLDQPLEELRQAFRGQVEIASATLAELAARAILLCDRSQRDRRRRMAWLGLAEHEEGPTGLPPDRVVAVISGVFLAFFLGITAVGGADMPMHRTFVLSLMIALIYGLAVTAAILPKGRWSWARRGPAGRPFIAYLLSGVVGAAAAALTMIVFKSVTFMSVERSWNEFLFTYPWLGMTFTAAILIAWLCDDRVGDGAPRWWLRWVEGAIGMAVLACAGWLVHRTLQTTPNFPLNRLPELEDVLLVSGAIGFTLSCCIPHWYRVSWRVSPVRVVSVPPPAPGATPIVTG
jgi:hypothetical protein